MCIWVDDLNAMAFKVSVICIHRPMSEQLAYTINGTSLSFQGHQNNAILQVKTSVNVGMARLVNLGAEMDLERGEQCEKKVVSKNKTLVFIFMLQA